MFLGSDASLGFRRGWTHGPLGLVLLPPLVTALLYVWDRWHRWRRPELAPFAAARLLGLSYLGCLTHPFLDWLNTYGVRLLMPFDERWFYGDALFIVDPWLWLVLGGALYLGTTRSGFRWGWMLLGVAACFVVLRSGEIVPGAARAVWTLGLVAIVVLRLTGRRAPRVAIATTALAVSGAYIGAMVAATTAGSIEVRRELARRGIAGLERLMVGPAPANPFAWGVVADLGDRYMRGTLRWVPQPEITFDARPIPKPGPSPILDAARAVPEVQGTLRWMRFPYAEVEETSSGWTVWFLDARYVRHRSRGFGAAVVEVPRSAVAPASAL